MSSILSWGHKHDLLLCLCPIVDCPHHKNPPLYIFNTYTYIHILYIYRRTPKKSYIERNIYTKLHLSSPPFPATLPIYTSRLKSVCLLAPSLLAVLARSVYIRPAHAGRRILLPNSTGFRAVFSTNFTAALT